MRKIQREETKVIYTDIYVSVDGKEFETEADCKAWESSYRGTMVASWTLINKVEAYSCELGLPWSNDDQECYLIKPKNLDEIALINAYIKSSTYGNSETTLTTNHIGKSVVLNFGYDHDYCDVYILADHIARITKYIATLEDKLNEKEETKCQELNK